jgi:phosphoglycerol transferase MdoB-like AlkP superfamily enzyme
MTTNIATENSAEIIELTPDFKIPVFLILGAVGFSWLSLWLAGAIAILGLFLTIQTFLIRLQFTDQALNVLRTGKIIRSFPYSEWLNWEIFWSPVPILFYFKEVNSIHFLPIIFNSKTLKDCLHRYYPRDEN